MSDKSMADVGRRLADALSWYARSRSDESRKEIARMHTELCLAWQDELRAAARAAPDLLDPHAFASTADFLGAIDAALGVPKRSATVEQDEPVLPPVG